MTAIEWVHAVCAVTLFGASAVALTISAHLSRQERATRREKEAGRARIAEILDRHNPEDTP